MVVKGLFHLVSNILQERKLLAPEYLALEKAVLFADPLSLAEFYLALVLESEFDERIVQNLYV